MDSQHLPLLRRAGLVLLVAGLADLAALAYCLANGIHYVSGFNLAAVMGGILLLRGSLLAASVVRWMASFLLAGGVALLLALPMMQPFSLTFAQLRLNQGPSLPTVALVAVAVLLLAWLVWQLGRAPVRAARQRAGLTSRDMRIPALAGVGLVVALGVFLTTMRVGATANRAKIMAEQKVGPGYRFHIQSLSTSRGDKGTSVVGVVTAWKEDDIQRIPVQWLEP